MRDRALLSFLWFALSAPGLSGAQPVTRADSASFAKDSIEFVALAAGDGFSCGLTAQGRAFCWGANQLGQLGSAAAPATCRVDYSFQGPCSLNPVAVDSDERFSQITAGDEHACALTRSGSAYCWGYNLSGQLGTKETSEVCFVSDRAKYRASYRGEPCSRRPVRVAGDQRFTSIIAGSWITCALTQDGRAFCWGDGSPHNAYDAEEVVALPQAVLPSARFTSLAAEPEPCGTTMAGEILCARISLGEVDSTWRVDSDPRFASIAGDFRNYCALDGEGSAYCWGDNSSGELGIGRATRSGQTLHPAAVVGGLRFKSLALGQGGVCGLSRDDRLYCWGDANTVGERATERCFHVDAWDLCATRPMLVLDSAVVRAVTVSGTHACAIDAAGVSLCWGSNASGQIGNGTTRLWRMPVRVMGPPPSVADDASPVRVYQVLLLLPFIAALIVLFRARRRLAAAAGKTILRFWAASLLALPVALSQWIRIVSSQGHTWKPSYAANAIVILAVELWILTIVVTLYWLAMRAAGRGRVTSP